MLSLRSHSVHDPRTQADRLTRAALERWVCADTNRETLAAAALTIYQRRALADYSDELGDETFIVRDDSAPDGAYAAGRAWCACRSQYDALCHHSLAVCLMLGYRSHYVRLREEAPLRVAALVVKSNPLTVRESMDSLQAKLAECRVKLGGVR